jgi:hypothetical protein
MNAQGATFEALAASGCDMLHRYRRRLRSPLSFSLPSSTAQQCVLVLISVLTDANLPLRLMRKLSGLTSRKRTQPLRLDGVSAPRADM